MQPLIREVSRPAADSPITTYVWPAESADATQLILVHGMSESAQNYGRLANLFNQNDISLITYDQIGHGQVAKANDTLGYFGGQSGHKRLVEDAHTVLSAYARNNQPIILLGHSMGSLVVRVLAQQYSQDFNALLAGVVLTGTMAPPDIVRRILLAGKFFNYYHPTQKNYFLHRLIFGKYKYDYELGKRVIDEMRCPPKDGQTHDEPIDRFVFTNNGFAELSQLLYKTTDPQWAQSIVPAMPLLVLTGLNDLFSRKGKDINRLAGQIDHLKQAKLINYNQVGHHVLFDDNQQPNYDLINWINAVVKI